MTYGFRGSDLVATRSLGNGLAGGTTYDPARRPTHSTLGGASFKPFTELLSWSPSNLKTAIQREDLNGQGYVVAYDDADRAGRTGGEGTPGTRTRSDAVAGQARRSLGAVTCPQLRGSAGGSMSPTAGSGGLGRRTIS